MIERIEHRARFMPEIPERSSTIIPWTGKRSAQLMTHTPAKIQKTTPPAPVKRATQPAPVKQTKQGKYSKQIREMQITTAARAEADVNRLKQRIRQIDIDLNMLLKADRSHNATAIENLKRERLDTLQRIEKLQNIHEESLKKAAEE